MSNPISQAVKENNSYLEPITMTSVDRLDKVLADTPMALVLVAKNSCPFCREFYPTWNDIARMFHAKLVQQDEKFDKDPKRSPPTVFLVQGEKAIADIADAFNLSRMTVPFIFFHHNGDNYLYGRSAEWMSLDNFRKVYPGAKILEETYDPERETIVVEDVNGRRFPTPIKKKLKAIRNPFEKEENKREIPDVLTSFARFTNKPELVPRPTKLSQQLNDSGAPHAYIGEEFPFFVPGLHVPPSEDMIFPLEMNAALVGQMALNPDKYRPHLFFVDVNRYTSVPASPPCIVEDLDNPNAPQHCQRDAVKWFLAQEEKGWPDEEAASEGQAASGSGPSSYSQAAGVDEGAADTDDEE